MQTITPNLWFATQGQEAARFYTSLFVRSGIDAVTYYDGPMSKVSGQPEDSVLTVQFHLAGLPFVALNGGPHFSFTPAISFFVTSETIQETEALWDALVDGGEVVMALDSYPWSEKYGWLNDRYGLSWQMHTGSRNDVPDAIVPSLLFVGPQHGSAESAIHNYISIFPDSRITGIHHYPPGGTDPEDTVMHAQFTLAGQTFMAGDSALDHDFTFTEAVSFIVRCSSQDEVDHYWNSLSADPDAEQCGWLKDRFGVSWQVVPDRLYEMLNDSDAERRARVSQSMLQMKKLDIAALEAAYDD